MVIILAPHQTYALGKEKLGKGHLDGKQLQHTPPQPRRGQWSPWSIPKTDQGHSWPFGDWGLQG